MIVGLQKRGIEPVVVFDGRSPREKAGTRSVRRQQKSWMSEEDHARHRVSSDDRNEVKQLLYALGVLSLNAEQEADGALAFLSRRGDLAAVITSDMDFLPRGVANIIIPNNPTNISTWTQVSLETLLETAGLSRTQFVEMCVLMGCDYAPCIPTVSYQTAYWLIRKATMLEILAREGIRTPTLWITAVSILEGIHDSWETIFSERQREKWAAGPPPTEPDAAILHKAHAHALA